MDDGGEVSDADLQRRLMLLSQRGERMVEGGVKPLDYFDRGRRRDEDFYDYDDDNDNNFEGDDEGSA